MGGGGAAWGCFVCVFVSQKFGHSHLPTSPSLIPAPPPLPTSQHLPLPTSSPHPPAGYPPDQARRLAHTGARRPVRTAGQCARRPRAGGRGWEGGLCVCGGGLTFMSEGVARKRGLQVRGECGCVCGCVWVCVGVGVGVCVCGGGGGGVCGRWGWGAGGVRSNFLSDASKHYVIPLPPHNPPGRVQRAS